MNAADMAPFPWFGGKSRVADAVWQRLGSVALYLEPFFGSGAVLLGAPVKIKREIVNDIDGYVCNFWRAVCRDPCSVASFADQPVFENDLHARHVWLLGQKDSLVRRLEGDIDFYDAKIAGWWVWGISAWISGGWCWGKGPWRVDGGELVRNGVVGAGPSVNRKLPHLGRPMGVHGSRCVRNRMESLSMRLRNVTVCCGEWSRIVSAPSCFAAGVSAVFLDPPYASRDRADCYAHDSRDVGARVMEWAAENGENPLLRIALCGYDDFSLPGWTSFAWKTGAGYAKLGNGRGIENAGRERIWFSPACVEVQKDMFASEVS